MSADGGGVLCPAQAPSQAAHTATAGSRTQYRIVTHSLKSAAPPPNQEHHAGYAHERGKMRPAAPGPGFRLPQETPGAGGGQYGECREAPEQLRQFVHQIGVLAGQDAEDDQDRTEPESDRCGRPQQDSDQNSERTHILGLIYTWLAA